MWKFKDDVFFDDFLKCRNFVTTKNLGNMRDFKNRKNFLAKTGLDCTNLTTAEQVHGNNVVVINKNNKGCHIPCSDGLITSEVNISLAIFTADCLPVFFDANGKAVGVTHAGWRGLANGILSKTIKNFKSEFDINAEDIKVSIGPHIHKCCYKVSKELNDIFCISDDQDYLDLSLIAVNQLKADGIKEISVCNNCTAHEDNLFFSYRFNKTTERIMSFVEIRG